MKPGARIGLMLPNVPYFPIAYYEMIIRGGYNVYPREIEDVLYEHPAVREAAVIGAPHDQLGEEVAAALSLKADASIAPTELRAYVKEQIAAYKYPRHVLIVAELPKGTDGEDPQARDRDCRIGSGPERVASQVTATAAQPGANR